MKIKWGALVVDGRGKLGGHVASQNKGGSYLRTKVTPNNPQTIFQSSVRVLFGAISSAWSALTAAQITAWNSVVDEWKTTNIFGDLKQPSGKNLHQRLNLNAQVAGFAAITDPPAKVDVTDDIITGAEFAIGAGTLTLAGLPSTLGVNVVLEGTAPVSAGTSFVKNKYRQFDVQGLAGYSATDAFDAYENRLSTVTLGDKIYIRVKYTMSNGQTSVPQAILADVVS